MDELIGNPRNVALSSVELGASNLGMPERMIPMLNRDWIVSALTPQVSQALCEDRFTTVRVGHHVRHPLLDGSAMHHQNLVEWHAQDPPDGGAERIMDALDRPIAIKRYIGIGYERRAGLAQHPAKFVSGPLLEHRLANHSCRFS